MHESVDSIAWIETQMDRRNIRVAINLFSELWDAEPTSLVLSADEQYYILNVGNVVAVEQNHVQLDVLSDIVRVCRPAIRDCVLTWDTQTRMHVGVAVHVWKERVISSAGVVDYPECEHSFNNPTRLGDMLDSLVDQRNAPRGWETMVGYMERICQVLYSRNEAIPTPEVSVVVESGSDTCDLEIRNMESLTYGAIEAITACGDIRAAIVEVDDDLKLLLVIGAGAPTSCPSRDPGSPAAILPPGTTD